MARIKIVSILPACILLLTALAPLAVPDACARRHARHHAEQAQATPVQTNEDTDANPQQQSEEGSEMFGSQEQEQQPSEDRQAAQDQSPNNDRLPLDPYARPSGSVSLFSALLGTAGLWGTVTFVIAMLVGGNCLLCAIVWHLTKALRGGQKPQVG